MSTPYRIRPVIREDVPTAVDTLGRAFADYPFTRHVVAADGHAARVRRFQELFLTRVGMVYGRVWVAGAGRAVAVWTTPDRDPQPGFAAIRPLVDLLAGDRAPWFAAAELALRPHRPAYPVRCLATVGVDPDEQGKGLGAAVIGPGLAAADRAGHPCFLETSTEQNVTFYERLGFTVTADLALPDRGPRTWCMIREPARRP
ncbi:GNAT family N-acetyltransferase [Streptomyces sp. NPDC047123]|uniref:GNAT family N-acetyltransferase n=1 Tax=Streptomyces sp. NPDC047123 TaxID=3155622 RepID=UPI0033DBFED1